MARISYSGHFLSIRLNTGEVKELVLIPGIPNYEANRKELHTLVGSGNVLSIECSPASATQALAGNFGTDILPQKKKQYNSYEELVSDLGHQL